MVRYDLKISDSKLSKIILIFEDTYLKEAYN